MSAIFNFESLVLVILLFICTCTYLRGLFPSIIDKNRTGVMKTLWKCARIGERKSPWIGSFCIIMAISILFFN